MSTRSLNQNGDTIVEVLIAIVIISSVLMGAFAISNLSLRQIRMAQERSEAQKIAEQSVENLDRMVKLNSSTLPNYASNHAFCQNADPYNSIDCASGTDNRYRTSITRLPDTPPSYGFAVSVSWDGLNGQNQNVTIDYKANRP